MQRTVEYYVKRKTINQEYYLSDFDFINTSDVKWCCSVKYAFSFPTFKAALALKTYIEETNSDYPELTIAKVTMVNQDVEGEE